MMHSVDPVVTDIAKVIYRIVMLLGPVNLIIRVGDEL